MQIHPRSPQPADDEHRHRQSAPHGEGIRDHLVDVIQLTCASHDGAVHRGQVIAAHPQAPEDHGDESATRRPLKLRVRTVHETVGLHRHAEPVDQRRARQGQQVEEPDAEGDRRRDEVDETDDGEIDLQQQRRRAAEQLHRVVGVDLNLWKPRLPVADAVEQDDDERYRATDPERPAAQHRRQSRAVVLG